MRILALDPARNCGFAFSVAKDRIDHSGVWNLGDVPQNRPGNLACLLRRKIEVNKPEVIAFEVATFGSSHVHVMRLLNELAGVIQAVASECGCESWPFGISTWKVRAVGKGNADKAGVMRGLRGFYGIEVTNDDEADAIAICLAAQQGPPPEPVKKQRRRAEKRLRQMPRLF